MKDNSAFDELGRVNLAEPCVIRLSVLGGGSYNVELTSVSLFCLQVDLPAQIGPADIPGSSKVELSEFPSGMDDLNHSLGTVIWIADGCCGIRFDSDLSGLDFGVDAD